jgi:hypothetical protein
MPTTFAVDQNNDLFIGGNGNLAIATGLQAVLLTCEQAAKAQRGEMVLDVNRGMPNFQIIWNGSPNLIQFEAALRKTLKAVAGVVEVVSLDVAITDNVLSYNARISTIYGTGVINGGI